MKKDEQIAEKIPKQAKKQNRQPGIEHQMMPKPVAENEAYKASDKLLNKVAIITGGDSGIGRAVAILFAKEGADVVISYLDEHQDATKVRDEIETLGRRCLLIAGDLSVEEHCQSIIEQTIQHFGHLEILVNNAGEQHPQDSIENITSEQLIRTFSTNIFSYFYLIKAALPYLREESSIINTTSVTCYKGNEELIDYSATKGAIVALTRSLSLSLAKKKIRVNGIAPGPVWTSLIVSTFGEEHIRSFGKDVPMGRPGQPEEIAPSYVFLASNDSSYISGQVLHPNGGVIING